MTYPFRDSKSYHAEVANVMEEVNEKIVQHGFIFHELNGTDNDGLLPPGAGAHCIPPGFATVGLTTVGLPEFYLSGFKLKDPRNGPITSFISNLRKDFLESPFLTMHPSAHHWVKRLNALLKADGLSADFMCVPVDRVRFMYGQSFMPRLWAEANGLVESLGAIQILWRQENGFPTDSNSQQLILDYAPFGNR